MDHRWGNRVPVNIDVRLTCRPEFAGVGRIENVSISGAFVRTELRPPLLSRARIIACLRTARGEERHETSGYVARHAADGIGIEWLELSPAMLSAVFIDPVKVPIQVVGARDSRAASIRTNP
jgi:hypothetical protein